MSTTPVSSYAIVLRRRTLTLPVPRDSTDAARTETILATIRCAGGTTNLTIGFVGDGAPVPAAHVVEHDWGGVRTDAYIFAPESRYAWYVDLLRTEEVEMHVVLDTPGESGLLTA